MKCRDALAARHTAVAQDYIIPTRIQSLNELRAGFHMFDGYFGKLLPQRSLYQHHVEGFVFQQQDIDWSRHLLALFRTHRPQPPERLRPGPWPRVLRPGFRWFRQTAESLRVYVPASTRSPSWGMVYRSTIYERMRRKR